jgi:hypothetical protein
MVRDKFQIDAIHAAKFACCPAAEIEVKIARGVDRSHAKFWDFKPKF